MKKIEIPDEWKMEDRSYYVRTHDPLSGRATGYGILDGQTLFDLHADSKLVSGINIRNISILDDFEFVLKDEIELVINPLIDGSNIFSFKVKGHHSFIVDWGDGHKEAFETDKLGDAFEIEYTHKYNLSEMDTIRIKIQGTISSFKVLSRNLLSINQLNLQGLKEIEFSGCVNLSKLPEKGPKELTSLYRAFSGCSNLDFKKIETWDLSKVRTMEECFVLIKDVNLNLDNVDLSSLVTMRKCFSHGINFKISMKDTLFNNLKDIEGMIDNCNGGSVTFDTSLHGLRTLKDLVKNVRSQRRSSITFLNKGLSVESLYGLIDNSSNVDITFDRVYFNRLETIDNLAGNCFGCQIYLGTCKYLKKVKVKTLWSDYPSPNNHLRIIAHRSLASASTLESLASNVANLDLTYHFDGSKPIDSDSLRNCLTNVNSSVVKLHDLATKERESYSGWTLDCEDLRLELNGFRGGFLSEYNDIVTGEHSNRVTLNGEDVYFDNLSKIKSFITEKDEVILNLRELEFGEGVIVDDLVSNCDSLDSTIFKARFGSNVIVKCLYDNCQIDQISNTSFTFMGSATLECIVSESVFNDVVRPDFSNWEFRGTFNVGTDTVINNRFFKDCKGDEINLSHWGFQQDCNLINFFSEIENIEHLVMNNWNFDMDLVAQGTFGYSACKLDVNGWHVGGQCNLIATFSGTSSKISMSGFSINSDLILDRSFSHVRGDLNLTNWETYGKVELLGTFKAYGSMGAESVQVVEGLASWRQMRFTKIDKAFEDLGNTNNLIGFSTLDLWNVNDVELIDPFKDSNYLGEIRWRS